MSPHASMRAAPRRLVPILAVLVLVAACEVIPQPGPAPDQYVLSPRDGFTAELPGVGAQLVVEEPASGRAIDTDRIALKPTPNEFKYFAGARWVDRAPKMIQTLLVQSFENSGKVVAVGRQAVGLRADYNLTGELRQFEAELFAGAGSRPRVRVRLTAKVVKQPRTRIVGSKSIAASVEAESADTKAVIAAFEAALGQVLGETVEWALRTIAEAD